MLYAAKNPIPKHPTCLILPGDMRVVSYSSYKLLGEALSTYSSYADLRVKDGQEDRGSGHCQGGQGGHNHRQNLEQEMKFS